MVQRRRGERFQLETTQTLGIEHPVLLAPMDLVSGGRLAAAVSHAGGLGLIGGGYGDWKETTFRIGHMGDIPLEDLNAMLDVLEEVALG